MIVADAAQSKPCLIPVAADAALAWARGRLDDADLILHTSLKPECVFFVNLPNLQAYREATKTLVYWWQRGAVCMIARTGTDAIDDHFTKNGLIVCAREETEPVKYRFFFPPEPFKIYMAKLARLQKIVPPIPA